ncbi:hypothetical protein DRJ04_06420 [Candidatus Aerophobetes bacterium]|uniref:Type II secretion system protein GspC N-terminal domain-containing protein n=1 Tax=Aerophobetes bacterium TaxID=2030807 RepID=A0A662DEH7_UNCAE|nr:MAG: hypothetical protein DRJ04_06420 [Candidatus Aerophobetes bacterium]
MKQVALFYLMMSIIATLVFSGELVFAEEPENFSLPAVFKYPVIKERDPFSPLIKKEEKPKEEKPKKKPLPVVTQSEYKLVGIVWYGERGVALISKGGKSWVAEEGQVLDGLKVARIEGERGEVILVGEDKIVKLRMLKI